MHNYGRATIMYMAKRTHRLITLGIRIEGIAIGEGQILEMSSQQGQVVYKQAQ